MYSDLSTMQVRAARTEQLVAEIVRRKRTAAHLVDGAVLTRVIGGVAAHFEADAVPAQFAEAMHVGEAKSFPTIDGQADAAGADKPGAALVQVSIYILRLREASKRLTSYALDSDTSCVSSQSLEIADIGRQHGGTRLGVSHDNGIDGGPFASPSP